MHPVILITIIIFIVLICIGFFLYKIYNLIIERTELKRENMLLIQYIMTLEYVNSSNTNISKAQLKEIDDVRSLLVDIGVFSELSSPKDVYNTHPSDKLSVCHNVNVVNEGVSDDT